MSENAEGPLAVAGEVTLSTTAVDRHPRTDKPVKAETARQPLRDRTNQNVHEERENAPSKRRRSDEYELQQTAASNTHTTLAPSNTQHSQPPRPTSNPPSSQHWIDFQALMTQSYDSVVRACLEAIQPADAALPVFPTPNPLVGVAPPIEIFSPLNAHMASSLHSAVLSSLQSAVNSITALQALTASEFAATINRYQEPASASAITIADEDVARVQRLAAYQAALAFSHTLAQRLTSGHSHSTFLSEMTVPDLQRFLSLAQTRRVDPQQLQPVPFHARRQSAPAPAAMDNVPVGVIGAPHEALPFPAGHSGEGGDAGAPVDAVFRLTGPLTASVGRASLLDEEPALLMVLLRRDRRGIVGDYMITQPQVTAHMRAVLLDWLRDISQENRVHEETYFLAARLLDRVLDLVPVPRKELQLLGASALLVAAKVEEHHAPPIKQFEAVCEKLYSRQQFITMQTVLTKKLEYAVQCPTAFTFLHMLFDMYPDIFDADMRNFCVFILYLSILDFRLATLLQGFYAHAIATMALIARGRRSDAAAITGALPLDAFRKWFAHPAAYAREILALTVRCATADPVMYYGESGFQYADGQLPENQWVVTNPREVTRGAMLCDNAITLQSDNEFADHVTWLLHDVCTVVRDVFHYHQSRWYGKQLEQTPLAYKTSHDYFGGRNFNNNAADPANMLGRTAVERFFAAEPATAADSCAIGKFATYCFTNKFVDDDYALPRGLPQEVAVRISKEIDALCQAQDREVLF